MFCIIKNMYGQVKSRVQNNIELSEIALSGASKLASTYFTLFYRSVHVLYTGIVLIVIVE